MNKLNPCSDQAFASTLSSHACPVLVIFSAPWCSPCQAMEPDLLAVAAKGTAHVVKMDVDENQIVAGQLGVRAMPTLILFIAGTPVKQLVGKQSRAAIDRLLRDAVRASRQESNAGLASDNADVSA